MHGFDLYICIQFQQYTFDAINKLTANGAKSLIIDVTNNGGGYVCLSRFLHTLLVGTEIAGQSLALILRVLICVFLTSSTDRAISIALFDRILWPRSFSRQT
jgi:hypothetical protein